MVQQAGGTFGRCVVAIATGARPILAPGWSGGPHTDIALVDCDVHQTVRQLDDLIPYMSRVYAQQAREQGRAAFGGVERKRSGHAAAGSAEKHVSRTPRLRYDCFSLTH